MRCMTQPIQSEEASEVTEWNHRMIYVDVSIESRHVHSFALSVSLRSWQQLIDSTIDRPSFRSIFSITLDHLDLGPLSQRSR